LRYANQNNRAYLGYSPQELADLSHIERVNVQNTDHRQFEQLSANQQTIYLEEVPSPVVDDQNDPSGRLLVLRDVTEERMLAAYREEITNMAIHDLRSPLASIINTIKLTRASMDKPDVLKRLEMPLGQSLQSAEKLLDLVNSMMDIAKLQTRQQVLNIAPANLHDVVESAYRALEATAAKNNIQIERLLPADLSPVNIDSDKVRRVFINLLDNALRFTPAGGLIQIRVTMQPGQKNVLVQVADSGKGIPPDAHERIFERYEQVTENQPLRGSKGTGLGLTFCKLVVEAQGGRIWVEPKGPLSGASFAFTLPLADEF
jgi:signal transduction histidine kinase